MNTGHACLANRLNLRAGGLESRLSSADRDIAVDVFDLLLKLWETTECVSCQKYHKHPTEAEFDCYVPKGMCN